MWLDQNQNIVKPVRYLIGYVLSPAQSVAEFPLAFKNWAGDVSMSRDDILDENKQLQTRNFILERRIQKLLALEVENMELRNLLSASEQVNDKVLVTSILAVDPDPFSQLIIIDKGDRDGAFVGQPVLDAHGLLGQVVEVMPFRSRVLMIADSNHAIPVQVNRNGVRAIAVGNGSLDSLDIIYVPNTADIKQGDVLVSSGLGGRYPKGYPVAMVDSVDKNTGDSFARVTSVPTAHLDRSRYLLLVFTDTAGIVPPDSLWKRN